MNELLFQREPRMDAQKLAFLSGRELPDAALIKTLLVASGLQGVPAKLKGKGESPASPTCITPAAPYTTIYPLHHLLGWDKKRPILVPLMKAAGDGNIVSTCYTLQVTHVVITNITRARH